MEQNNPFLSDLHVVNFKNCSSSALNFSPGFNCLVGENGAGKTGILDAIFYLCLGKDAFNSTDQQNIRNNEQYFRIEGNFISGDRKTEVAIACQKGQRKVISADKIPYTKASLHVGKFPVVIITPDDHDLIVSGGEARRRWLDQTLSQTDALYLDDLVQYAKALAQRNALLKQNEKLSDTDLLDALDKQLDDYGTRIFEKRKTALTDIIPHINQFYSHISGNKESVKAAYSSQLSEKKLYSLLKETRAKDKIIQHTTSGIHRDDIEFELDDMTVRKYSSQGQIKSLVCAIKLAQYSFIRGLTNKKSILLLDDIFDKLDESRVQSLLKLLSGNDFGQVFITDAHKHRLEELFMKLNLESKFFKVKNGAIVNS